MKNVALTIAKDGSVSHIGYCGVTTKPLSELTMDQDENGMSFETARSVKANTGLNDMRLDEFIENDIDAWVEENNICWSCHEKGATVEDDEGHRFHADCTPNL